MIYMTILMPDGKGGEDFGEVWLPERFLDKYLEAMHILEDVAVIKWKEKK